jgi:hypothetical protein
VLAFLLFCKQRYPVLRQRNNPVACIKFDEENFQAHATDAEEPERGRLFNQMVEVMPGFDDYHRKTTRVTPVIVLTPVKKNLIELHILDIPKVKRSR